MGGSSAVLSVSTNFGGWAWTPNRWGWWTVGAATCEGEVTTIEDAAAGGQPTLLSVAVTVKGKVPAAVGVPLISPAGLSVSPGGKAVLLAWAKVTGDVPPLVESCA